MVNGTERGAWPLAEPKVGTRSVLGCPLIATNIQTKNYKKNRSDGEKSDSLFNWVRERELPLLALSQTPLSHLSSTSEERTNLKTDFSPLDLLFFSLLIPTYTF